MSPTTEISDLKINLLALGLKLITAPTLQFCVDQNINSLTDVSQFVITPISLLKSSNTNP